VWVISLLVSVALHVAVLVLSPVFLRVGPPSGGTTPEPSSFDRALQAMQVRSSPAADPEDPALDPPAATAEAPVPVRPPATEAREPAGPRGVPSDPARPAQPAAGEPSLSPGIRDPRLWVTPRDPPPPAEPTPEELHARYMAGLEARIRAYNDSIAGDLERARRATDWTVSDKDGKRWGVSPDGIHLGDVKLPPVNFPPGGGDPDKRARAEQEERTRRELDQQQSRQDARRAQEEGARATRERKDAERRSGSGN
jgi:hypothetical protein